MSANARVPELDENGRLTHPAILEQMGEIAEAAGGLPGLASGPGRPDHPDTTGGADLDDAQMYLSTDMMDGVSIWGSTDMGWGAVAGHNSWQVPLTLVGLTIDGSDMTERNLFTQASCAIRLRVSPHAFILSLTIQGNDQILPAPQEGEYLALKLRPDAPNFPWDVVEDMFQSGDIERVEREPYDGPDLHDGTEWRPVSRGDYFVISQGDWGIAPYAPPAGASAMAIYATTAGPVFKNKSGWPGTLWPTAREFGVG